MFTATSSYMANMHILPCLFTSDHMNLHKHTICER